MLQPLRKFNVLFIGYILINILQSIFTPLIPDEAYYWVYSQNLSWGFFDHPPMVAYLIKLGNYFFSDELETVTHIDFTFPYKQILRYSLIQTAKQLKLPISTSATYGCTQGPRLESAAEIKRMEQDGCDLVGMTGMPEAALAKEMSIKYATIAVVVNWAAGKSEGEITMSEIEIHLKKGMKNVLNLLTAFISD